MIGEAQELILHLQQKIRDQEDLISTLRMEIERLRNKARAENTINEFHVNQLVNQINERK